MTAPTAGDERASDPPRHVLTHFGASVTRALRGRVNRHWLVARDGVPAVLRRYAERRFGDIGFELRVLEELHARGWPTPRPLAEPLDAGGTVWALFEWLPGEPREDEDEAGQRARGRLLAQLHEDLAELTVLGQRGGCRMVDEVVADPRLHTALARYERFFPDDARLLRWHAERAQARFGEVDLGDARRVVVHSDFTPWNLLFADGALTGVLDFEATHLDYAVADFALAWRGRHDAVVRGYDEVRSLDDLDWAILTPAFWAWLFLGVADLLERMTNGTIQPARLEWVTRKLVVRSPLMAAEATPYTPI